MKIIISTLSITILICGAFSCSSPRLTDGEHTIHVVSTGDIHGRYLDSLYVTDTIKESLLAVSAILQGHPDLTRQNRILLDLGDFNMGDPAADYFNYVDTTSIHLFAKMTDFMSYDAVIPGNHDIQVGHPAYDRLKRTMTMPMLAANIIDTKTGQPYFNDYIMVEREGLRIAVIGFSQTTITKYAAELWSGMEIKNILSCAQEVVDKVIAEEKPDIVILAAHTGAGEGDGTRPDYQGKDLLNSLKNVDYLICAHDHIAAIYEHEGLVMADCGSRCKNLAHASIKVSVEKGKIVSKKVQAELIPVDKTKIDACATMEFHKDYVKVKDWVVSQEKK